MPGLPFNTLPAGGPMAQQAEQERQAAMKSIDEEYEVEARALGQQILSRQQFQNKLSQLRGKYSLTALKMNREWNQRMTQIQEYEKLGMSGAMPSGQATQAQYALSGYDVPQRKRPDYWAEHRNLIQERERIQAEFLDPWDRKKGKGPWRLVTGTYPKTSKKWGQPSNWGEKATLQELQQIEAAQRMIGQLDQYEFALLSQMDPQQRKINQLSRAMAMGPRTQQTPGVGRKRERILLGTGTPEDPFRGYAPDGSKREQEQFETPGYKLTRKKAVVQARRQLGPQANKERVLTLAKQIYERYQ